MSIGISTGSGVWQRPQAQVAAEMKLIAALGAQTIRLDMHWDIVEPSTGTFLWTIPDMLFDAADAEGLRVEFILDNCPGWANGDTGWYSAPINPADYGAFAAACVNRYMNRGGHGGCHWWEIQNEPNNPKFFRPNTDHARYVSLLQEAHEAIKAADPEALVIMGGIAAGGTAGATTHIELDTEWLTGVYEAGASLYFDVLAFHPYSKGVDPADTTNTENGWNRLSQIQAIIIENGDQAKPVWCNEFGQATGTGISAVTEAQQATYLGDALTRARGVAGVQRVFVYGDIDSGTDTTDANENYGLYHCDMVTAKAAASVFRSFAVVD